ncbi:MAG: hypothetical protein IKC69_04730 [Clostridia bacterium]|nr:hypothetical protein [Clostridia bacterium]
MKTAREILNRALTLLGEGTEPEEDGAPFRERTVELVNVLLSENSDLRSETPPSGTVPQITSTEDEVPGEDAVVLSLFPLGLAAYLIEQEDAARGAFFRGLYREEKERIRMLLRRGRRHKIGRGKGNGKGF